jgi:glycosyltransferase involved in cell wall biosynthesis
MKSKLTIILPAHNEGLGIFNTLLEIDELVPNRVDIKIFVSEDGSSDNTRQEVMRASSQTKNCKIQLSQVSDRLGYSKAVIRGISECESEFIGFMDADGQCDPKDISSLFDCIKKNTIVCGFRNPRRDPKLRLIYSKLFNLVYRIFGGPKLIDPSSPFVMCRTEDISFLVHVKPRLSYGFWWEFQMRIAAARLNIVEIPISHRKRLLGTTQVYNLTRMPKIISTHLSGLVKLRYDLR